MKNIFYTRKIQKLTFITKIYLIHKIHWDTKYTVLGFKAKK